MSHHYKTLSDDEVKAFGEEIDELRQEVKESIGEQDVRYIKSIQRAVRYTGVIGRGALFLSFFPPFWIIGVLFLSLSKILDNMELGHNVIHGQFDFMGDPHLNGKKYEWDIAGTSDNWRETHNYRHHTYTNIEGHDEDIGYGFIRVFAEQKWNPWYLLQPVYAFLFAFVFQWGVALQNVNFLPKKDVPYLKGLIQNNPAVWNKFKWQIAKDYIVFPLLAGPFFVQVLLGNMVANVIRSIWTFVIIFCGHFTEKTVVFPASEKDNDSSGHWYLRQIQSSSNIRGSRWFHILSGNLSHQIEHHLFPDLPANRYRSLAPRVEEICNRYGQTYNTGRLSQQFSQVIFRIVRHAFPSTPTA
jgi:linoleoyl-CoA desaturase